MHIGICIAGNVDFDLNEFSKANQIEKWIAVDGGYDTLLQYQIKPEILIGDLDSISDVPNDIEILKLECEKGETDFEVAKNYVLSHFDVPRIFVVGIVGSERIEHFIANLRLIDNKTSLYTKNNIIKHYAANDLIILKQDGHEFISLFAIDDIKGLTITGAKYNVIDRDLDHNSVLGISNEFSEDEVKISFTEGRLMLILSGNYYK